MNLSNLFQDIQPPPVKLVESFSILGVSVQTLRSKKKLGSLLDGSCEIDPEVLLKYPPWTSSVSSSALKMVFTESTVRLQEKQTRPHFFSTTITDAEGGFTNVHCLVVYERVTPSLVEQSFGWRAKNKDYELRFSKNLIMEKELFLPVVVCIMSKSTYVDVFREILMKVFSSLLESAQNSDQLNGSVEFLNSLLYLASESIIPPLDTELKIDLQGKTIVLPVESFCSLRHNESCISLVLDLVDIKSLVQFWEAALLNKHLFVIGSNDYLLFSVLEAMKILIFPLRWDLNIIPVLNPSLSDYMGSVPPIMIGINSSYVEKYHLLAKEKDDVVLNIDSGTFSYSGKSQSPNLCKCTLQALYNKLQLIKNYSKYSKEKIFELGLSSLEDLVEDKKFVEEAKKLLECKTEKLVNSLVQKVFFGFFETIVKFQEFMGEVNGGEVMFFTEKFIDQIKTCGTDCKMKEFWKLLIDGSMTFQIFLDNFNKIDQSYLKRFKKIVKGKKNMTGEAILMQSGINDKDFVEKFKFLVKRNDFAGHQEKFQFKILDQIFEDLEIFHRIESKKEMIRSFADLYQGTTDISIFYGEYGVLRINKAFLMFLTPEILKELYKDCSLRHLPNIVWEQVIVSLYVELKEDSTSWDAEKMLLLLLRLNSLNTQAIPNHYTALIIDLLRKKDGLALENIQLCKGHLRKIVRYFFQSSYTVRTVSISSKKELK